MTEHDYIPSALAWVREQVDTYERSGGTEATTLRETGIPIIVVTMRGAATGAIRKIALMRVEHDGQYALVASYGGRPASPAWYRNLLAHPDDVTVQDGPAPFPVSVREVFGDERAEWWERAVAVFPTYAEYQISATASSGRVIPVLVATRR